MKTLFSRDPKIVQNEKENIRSAYGRRAWGGRL
jgi:hypothetical protein